MSKRWGGELWGWENLGGELWFRQEFHQTHPGGFIRPLHTQTPSPGGAGGGKRKRAQGQWKKLSNVAYARDTRECIGTVCMFNCGGKCLLNYNVNPDCT